MHNTRMDLEQFMEVTETSDVELAGIIRRDRSTVSRIRRKVVVPDGITLTRINEWADRECDRKPHSLKNRRLTWLWLGRAR